MQIKIDWKIIIFVLLFFILGNEKIYILFLIFIIIHELSHMIVGVLLGFIPNIFAITSFGCHIGFRTNIDNYNKKLLKGTIYSLKNIIIALAGPISNIIIISLFLINSKYNLIIYINLIIAIFNLLPIYPLDGGRVIKNFLIILIGRRKSLKYIDLISNIVLIFLVIELIIFALYYKSYIIIIGIIYLIYLRIIEHKRYKLKERIYKILETKF